LKVDLGRKEQRNLFHVLGLTIWSMKSRKALPLTGFGLRKDKGFSFSALSLIAKQNFGQYSLELARTWKLFKCTFSGGSQIHI
jgi:hypothetical protein